MTGPNTLLELLKAVLMGIVEGITEWLPISSTGHLILLEQMVQFELSDAFLSMFRVVIQLGAILAVVLLYFDRLWPFTADASAHYTKPGAWALWGRILVGSLPAAVLGLLLDDWLDAHLYNYWVVAAMLILYGILFLVIERRPRRPRISRIGQLTLQDALIIGFWQVLAMVPGTSRSGATIVGALLLGASRPLAAQFTFFLAVPVMFGASGLKLVKFFAGGGVLTGLEIGVLVTGMAVAFVVSLVSIGFLMNYVKKHNFRAFGWYRIALGSLVLMVAVLQKWMFR